jgi:hypothetical protein
MYSRRPISAVPYSAVWLHRATTAFLAAWAFARNILVEGVAT